MSNDFIAHFPVESFARYELAPMPRLDMAMFTGKPGTVTPVRITESEPELDRIRGRLRVIVVARGGILVPMTPLRWLVYSFARTCLQLSAKNALVLSGW